MTAQEFKVLGKIIARHKFLYIDDENSDKETGYAVLDRRVGSVCIIEHPDQVTDLVEMGAEWYLNSEHNGGKLTRK